MKMSLSTPLRISAPTNKILRTLKLLSQENQISTLEMPSTSSTPTEAEEFLQLNSTLDLMPLVFMPLMRKLIFSLPDTMAPAIENLKPENLRQPSLPTMLSLTPKLPEDHLTIPQDQSEEMTASNQEPPMNISACGEPSLELKTPLSSPDKDLPPDQDSTLMKPSTPSIKTVADPSARANSCV
jgi:hypothetical protein